MPTRTLKFSFSGCKMATLVNPSSSSSTSSNGRGLYDSSQTPPPLHSSHSSSRHHRGPSSAHENETGSDASSPPPTTSSHRDYDPAVTESPGGTTSGGYMTTAAAAAAAAAAISASTSSADDQTAQFEADKRAIYKHPLFPLLALLFEKCELATQSSECPSTESFNLDIQAFVQHQGREGKPFFTDNQDVNDLVSSSDSNAHIVSCNAIAVFCR